MTAKQIHAALSARFPPGVVQWKPQAISGERALAVAYIDCRAVQSRLDEVMGIAGWQEEMLPLEDGSVMCRLSLKIEGEWITKCDCGSPSDNKDAGERRKAACSDALKRAAVKFGVGRYLYSLPKSWVEYDPKRKQIIKPPELPKPTLLERLQAKEVELGLEHGKLIEAVLLAGAAQGMPARLEEWNGRGVGIAKEVVEEMSGVRA